jgi:hypothetical protein
MAVGEEPEWAALAVPVEQVNRVPPGIELGGVEFAQVEHLALDHAVTTGARAFADGVVAVGLADFGARAAFEKHAGRVP